MMRRRNSVVLGSSSATPLVRGWVKISDKNDIPPSAKLEPTRGKNDHLQQQPAVPPALNVRFSIPAGTIANRHLHDLMTLAGGAEQQIEIPKGIEVAEITSASGDFSVVA